MNAKKAIITLSTLLALSVCGNAFLGGIVLTHGHRGPPPLDGMMDDMRGPPNDGPDGGPDGGPNGGPDHAQGNPELARFRAFRDFARGLPPDVRQPIMEAFKGDRDAMQENVRNIKDARAHTIDVLKAEPFDADKLREALVAQRGAQSATQTHVHEILLDVIAKLTPEQRSQLADSAQRLFK